MLKGLIDRQGNRLSVSEALNKNVEIGFPRSMVEAIVRYADRAWDGMVHPTDIITCVRQRALKMTEEYYVPMDKTIDSMIGTSMHRFFTTENQLHNFKVKNNLLSGEMDLLEIDETEKPHLILYDFKVVKSFPVKKALGIYKEDVPVLDEDGNQVYYKSGKKAGEAKTRKEVRQDFSKRDVRPYTRQLNLYRWIFNDMKAAGTLREDLKDLEITQLIVMQLLKEAGQIAAENGIEHSSYPVPIPIVDEQLVKEFAIPRIKVLKEFMTENGDLPGIPEDPEDVWQGRMCSGFCPVAESCKIYNGGSHPYI